MLLRTRLILIMIFAFLAIIVVLAATSIVREDIMRGQFGAAITADRETLWRKIVENSIQRMEDKAWYAHGDLELVEALSNNDQAQVIKASSRIFGEIISTELADRLDVLTEDGTLVYSSTGELNATSIILPATIIGTNERLRGVGNDLSRNVAIALSIPIRVTGSKDVVGYAIFSTHIDEALEELRDSTDSDVFIVNRRKRLLASTNGSLWEDFQRAEAEARWDPIAGSPEILLEFPAQLIRASSETYLLSLLPMNAELGSLRAYLITARDATEWANQRREITRISTFAVAFFVILAILLLSWYLRHSLAPLTRSVSVLDMLSRGQTDADLELEERNDEVGHIADAINRLRTDLQAFASLRRSREKQRKRQERYIRREMTKLAGTLDTADREEVLRELHQIEQQEFTQNDHAHATGDETLRSVEGLNLMALAFEKMRERIVSQQGEMSGLISELREALESKTAYAALQQELEIGKKVQLSSLPGALPESDDVELEGIMIPAKEVGGDFYDYFVLDQNRIGIAVADVSGKGVPAALFMAISRTLLRAVAPRFDSPGACLEHLNDLLVQNNEEELFVTVFYGIYDRTSQTLLYANGGHNAPMMVQDQEVSEIPLTGGMALAVFDGITYDEKSVSLSAGERLFFFTDGITEAVNSSGEEYAEHRLSTVLGRLVSASSHETLQGVIEDVNLFVGNEDPFDDMTCVCLHQLPMTKTEKGGN